MLSEHSPLSCVLAYRTSMRRNAFLCLLAFLVGCGGGTRVTTRERSPARRAAAAPDSLVPPWTFRGTERPRAQRVDISSVIESRFDTLLRVDTLATRAWYDWAEHPDAANHRVAGMVRAFAVRSGTDSLWRVLDAPALPVSFVAEVPWEGSAPELQLPRADGCDPQAAVVPGWRETWVSPPPTVSVGSTWRDSSVTPLCRDGIVLHSTAVRTFVVEGVVEREGKLRIVVRRSSRARVSGSGVQFGDTLRFTGEASGGARLELLLQGAVIAAGEGSSELRLTMRGRRRTQELVQRSALQIAIP